MRHSALRLDGSTLSVFYTDVGDSPERILLSTIELTQNRVDAVRMRVPERSSEIDTR
mgnify:CR=1 FL=1